MKIYTNSGCTNKNKQKKKNKEKINTTQKRKKICATKKNK